MFIAYAAWLGGPEHTCFSRIATVATGISLLFTIAGVLRNWAWFREFSASVQLLVMSFMVVSNLVGVKLLSFDPYHDPRYAIFLSATLALCAIGLLFRWFVSRWMAIALAVAGVGSAGLNLVPWRATQSAYSWTLAIHIAGALLVIANLAGPTMRQRFEEKTSPLWSSPDPILRSIRWTILTFFAAIPMLLVYSWMQPIVPATQGTALVLALFLTASITLSISRRVVGAVGLVLGGIALLVQCGVTLSYAYEISPRDGKIALYYAAFWLPAGLAAIHSGVRMARPILRLLRGPGHPTDNRDDQL